MNIRKYIAVLGVVLIAFASCKKDDDQTVAGIVTRDIAEQTAADDVKLKEFLETHFYNYEAFEAKEDGFDYKIVIDTLNEENTGKQSLFDQIGTKVVAKKVNVFGADHTVYVLKAREGVGETVSFADSAFVNYKGISFNELNVAKDSDETFFRLGPTFDSSKTPIWFDLAGGLTGGVIPGFGMGLDGFKGASAITKNMDTGLFEPTNDYGIGAVFIPTALAYFANPPSSIGQYQSLIFTFDLLLAKSLDHDQDGTLSREEDANGNLYLRDDNADGDGFPDYLDADTK